MKKKESGQDESSKSNESKFPNLLDLPEDIGKGKEGGGIGSDDKLLDFGEDEDEAGEEACDKAMEELSLLARKKNVVLFSSKSNS